MEKILLQAILVAGYGAGGVLAWRGASPSSLRLLHRSLPALALAHAVLTAALSATGDGAGFDLSVAVVGFALVLLCTTWAQNVAWAVHGTYRFVLPVCALAALAPSFLPTHLKGAGSQGAVFWAHLFLAAMAYSFVLLAFVQLLVRRAEERAMRQDVGTAEGRTPLLTIERLAVRNAHAGLALLTLTLASGIYFAVAGPDGSVALNHKNLFAALTWATLLAFVVGHRVRGWRGRTALNYMGAGMVFLALSYFGTAFVLQVVLGR